MDELVAICRKEIGFANAGEAQEVHLRFRLTLSSHTTVVRKDRIIFAWFSCDLSASQAPNDVYDGTRVPVCITMDTVRVVTDFVNEKGIFKFCGSRESYTYTSYYPKGLFQFCSDWIRILFRKTLLTLVTETSCRLS